MLEDFKEPAPEGAELEAFLSGPKHHLARLIRDLFAEEASATTMEVSSQFQQSCVILTVVLAGTSRALVHHCSIQVRVQSTDKLCGGVQNPIQAIVQHAEHNVLYAQDPLMQGFHARHISHMLDIVCENQGQTGFTVAEIGAGTGGFTRQVRANTPTSLSFSNSL